MQIKISEILNDLTNGQTRQQIKEKYNLSTAQLKSVFAHPQLKGRKTKKVEQPIDLLDDVTQEVILTQKVISEITNPVEDVEETTVENSTLAAFE
jgi:t-SNARE complex subunit (syntaxin)